MTAARHSDGRMDQQRLARHEFLACLQGLQALVSIQHPRVVRHLVILKALPRSHKHESARLARPSRAASHHVQPGNRLRLGETGRCRQLAERGGVLPAPSLARDRADSI